MKPDRLATRLLRYLDPETAHGVALKALQAGLGPKGGPVTSQRLATKVARLSLPNPVGLAAGFDKNAMALAPLARAGFGFIEAGAVTPRAQEGNPRPRLYRLADDRAAINRFGFNNAGMEAACARLAHRPEDAIIGLNLGANKDSADRSADFAQVLTHCGPHLDFATVNVSSPNTENLRDLQGPEALSALLRGVAEANDALETPLPIFLKIAPDLSDDDLAQIVQVAEQTGVAAITATNTTLDRAGLSGRDARENAQQKGGLSGQPLFEKSTRVLAKLSTLTDLPLIGVGGVANADQAYAKITAGASAVQLYTALAYEGLSLVRDIAEGLDALLARDGHASVADAVGSNRAKWL